MRKFQNSDSYLYTKSDGKLVTKGQEGLGRRFFRQLRRLVPQITGMAKEVEQVTKKGETVAKKSETATKLQKGVERAQKISKSAQFKELVNGLGLEDRVSQELISRYNTLDPNKQKAERDIVYNLMKNGQIHSITDFDLAVDKIGRGKQAKDPNLYKYKTLADFDSEHTLGYFQKLENDKLAKEKYDKVFGSFEKRQDFPKVGLSLYEVPQTTQGQTDLAYVMRMQDSKTPAPWCVLQTDEEGNPTVYAQKLWNGTYGGPKYVLADGKGKIQYFKSGNEYFFNKQDQPMGNLEKNDRKTGIKTSYNIIGRKFPFQFVVGSKRKTMKNGNRIELYYSLNGRLAQGYIRRPNNYTALLYPKNEPAEVTLYEKGPENVLLSGTWVTTPSGQRLFKTRDQGKTKTYDVAGRMLTETQGDYSTTYDPQYVLTSSGGHMALWDRNTYLNANIHRDLPLYNQHKDVGIQAQPLFRQFFIPSTGELIKDGDYPDFKDIGEAIQQLGFKFPIYKKGGILKGQNSVKFSLERIGREIRKAVKEAQGVPKVLNTTQLSGIKDMAEVAVKHPKKVWKSIPLYFNGINQNKNITDQKDFIANNFDLFNNFYRGFYKFKFGKTSEQEAKSGLNHLYADNGILQFNLKQRAQFAKNNGYILDTNGLIGDVRNIPQTFHYFPFTANSYQIRKNNLGWFDRMSGVHINTANTRRWDSTSKTIIHENEHALQDEVAKEILSKNKYYDPNTMTIKTRGDLGNFEYTYYFPEEQQLLDDIYHIDWIDNEDWIRQYDRDSRNLPYQYCDHRSPLEQGATNTEVKYIYANDYGVDFSKLKDYTELPDLIEIDEGGNLVHDPFSAIPSKYADKYQYNLCHNIKEETRRWKRNNYNYTREDLLGFISGLNRKYNDALKKAVFYVGGLTGAAYLGSELNNQQDK